MSNRRQRLRTLGFSVGLAALSSIAGTASADWGMGLGWGWGMGFGPSSSTQFLNDHAARRAAAGGQGRRMNSIYSGNSNAYFQRIRDNGFVSHYDARRRRSPSYQRPRAASLGDTARAESRPAPAPAASPAPMVETLANFFDATLRVAWPHDAPRDGELGEKRDLSDKASLAVLDETKRHGTASIAGAAEARQRLVEYGRPALQHLRATATPPVADAFHQFMLSLYDSLEAAAAVE